MKIFGRKELSILGVEAVLEDDRLADTLLSYSGSIKSTCDMGLQTVSLTPGASSTCGGGNCSCCSSCCW
ncbi:MAG: hypothetical protein WBN04_21320 [Paracoccaceae bacterium]